MLKNFFTTITQDKTVWVMKSAETIVSFEIPNGTVVPVWSEENMVNSYLMITNKMDHYQPQEIDMETFLKVWIPTFEKQGYLLGINLGIQKGKAEFMSLSDFKMTVESENNAQ